MPENTIHPHGSPAYWQKMATTRQQIIDKQRRKIARLERELQALADEKRATP